MPYLFRILSGLVIVGLLLGTYLLRDKTPRPETPRGQRLALLWVLGTFLLVATGAMSLVEMENDAVQADIDAGRRLGWDAIGLGRVGPSYEGPPPLVFVRLDEKGGCPLYVGDLYLPLGIDPYNADTDGPLPQAVKDRLVANDLPADACDKA